MANKTFTWDIGQDSTETTAVNKSTTQFGDGYEQTVSFGINNARKSWQCNKIDKKAVIDEMYRFLTGSVEAFNFQPIKSEPSIKVRLDGDVIRNQEGADTWKISFTLKQVF